MTHYEILGLSPSATEDEVRRAVAQLSTQWSRRSATTVSLEKRQDAGRMLAAIAQARSVLLEPGRRGRYDAELASLDSREQPPCCPYCAEPLPGVGQSCRWCTEPAALPAAAAATPAPPPPPLAPASPQTTPARPDRAVAVGTGVTLLFFAAAVAWAVWPKTPPFHYDFRQDMLNQSHLDQARPMAQDAWVLPAMFPELVQADGTPTVQQQHRAAGGYGMPGVWSHLRGCYVQPGHQEDIFLAAIEDPTTAHPENWHKYYVAVFEGRQRVAGPFETGVIDGFVSNVRFSQSPVDHVLTRAHFMAQGYATLSATLARVEADRLDTLVDFGAVGTDDTGAYGDARATVMAAAVAYVPGTWPPEFRVDEYEAPGGTDAERLKFTLKRSRKQLDVAHSLPAAE